MPHLDRRCFLEGKHLLEGGVLVFHCGYRQVQHLLDVALIEAQLLLEEIWYIGFAL